MSQLPQSEMDDLMGTLRADSYASSKPRSPRAEPRIRPHINPIQKQKALTMNDFDGIIPSFGTYIRYTKADREKLYADWCKAREQLPPTGTAEAACNTANRLKIYKFKPSEPPTPAKIKYCNELTCSVPYCEHSGHDGHMPRTKCGCGCPE